MNESIPAARRAPNLIILGAQKSATTSLYHLLRRHPDIHMSYPVKEPGYYMGEDWAARYWKRHSREVRTREEIFDHLMVKGIAGERLFGDASTYYTIGNNSRFRGVPARIRKESPDARFIYVVRNPLDRIVSNYLHSLRGGSTHCSLEQFLEQREGERAVLTSMYFYQLQAYLEYFPLDQILVLSFDDLLAQDADTLKAVQKHLALSSPICGDRDSFPAENVATNRNEVDATQMTLSSNARARLRDRLLQDMEDLQNLLRDRAPQLHLDI